MKKELAKWELSGFIITIGLGTLLHFVYEWTNDNKFTALFSAVNESTWEHLKLIFFPFAIFSVIEYFITGRQYKGYFTVKAEGVVLGMLSIVVLFYTYKGIISIFFNKKHDDIVIEVMDNGSGMDKPAGNIKKKDYSFGGVGLSNSKERLHLIYGDNADIQINSSKGKGTCITITFPAEK